MAFLPPPAPRLPLGDGSAGQTASTTFSFGRACVTIWPGAMSDERPCPRLLPRALGGAALAALARKGALRP
eukprot:3296143-Alexandrium_andersonii.AAC.1